MPDGAMFEPLSEVERQAPAANPNNTPVKRPLVPVPADAPPMQYRHSTYGYPTAEYEYQLPTGELAGYVCRFDTLGEDGKSDKIVLPVTYCELGGGQRRWRARGIPTPRPLYRAPEIVGRPDVWVVICEGEKAADAAVAHFPDHVATTPMHGAKSPHRTDYSLLSGRAVTIWPDNDEAGIEFAEKVAALATQAGTASVSIVPVPKDWPAKWDLADPLPEGVDPASLRYLLEMAIPWQPPPTTAGSEHDQPEMQPALQEAPAAAYLSFGPYQMKGDGLFFVSKSREEPPIWLSGPFEVLAQTRDGNSDQWGLLLHWLDPDGQSHDWAMPKEALGGGREEIWRALLREGLTIVSSPKGRGLLADYLAQAEPQGRALGLSRIGWHHIQEEKDRMVFVLPDVTLGEAGNQRVLWQTEGRRETHFGTRGELDHWKAEVATKCIGNSRLVFAVSLAFAPPLLKIANEESGGFHLKGQSRAGKTVVLRVASSVWGGGDNSLGFACSWRATANGLEGIAEAHNDALLLLDEMGQVDAREAGEVAYMLANGTGKGRAGRDGSPRRSAQWRLLFLSTGEVALAEKMAEIGKQPKAGQEIRLVEIPADAGANLGVFEHLHGAESGGAFAEELRAATNRLYGTPSRTYLEKLTDRYSTDPDELCDLIKASRAEFIARNQPPEASGQVRSVCGRFALVAAAGSLATAFGLTGWPDDEADRAAAACFKAWLTSRGSAGDYEIEAGIRQVTAFIEAHGSSRFEAVDSGSERVNNRVGYREQADGGCWRYYVSPEMWLREVAKGFDAAVLAKAMVARSLIIPGNDGKPARQKKVKGENIKLYWLAPSIVADDGLPDDRDVG